MPQRVLFRSPSAPRALHDALSQSVEVGADDGIALARCGFQPLAVPRRDAPVRVADESSLLQRGGNDADGRTLHTEHDRQKLVPWSSAVAPTTGLATLALRGWGSADSRVSGGSRLRKAGRTIAMVPRLDLLH